MYVIHNLLHNNELLFTYKQLQIIIMLSKQNRIVSFYPQRQQQGKLNWTPPGVGRHNETISPCSVHKNASEVLQYSIQIDMDEKIAFINYTDWAINIVNMFIA